METRQQGSTLFSAVLVLIAILVVIQLWLVAAAVDALLSRQMVVLVPTAIASAAPIRRTGGGGVRPVRPMNAISTLAPASRPDPSVRNLASSRRVM